jgi:hypothetical protein
MLKTVTLEPTTNRNRDPQADAECEALLDRVDELRRELRKLEPELHIACNNFGKRRGYIGTFNEWNVRNTLEIERGRDNGKTR